MIPTWILKNITWPIVFSKATFFGVDPYLVASIIMTESYGQNCAMKYEPKWRYHFSVKKFAKLTRSSIDTEKIGQATSWGPMQVMGTVAREHGFMGYFPNLCEPEIGIHYGVKHLKSKLEKYVDMKKAISAYNAGSPTTSNTHYVNRVMSFYEEITK